MFGSKQTKEILTFFFPSLLHVLNIVPVDVRLVQWGMVVEQVRHEGKVQLVHALNHVLLHHTLNMELDLQSLFGLHVQLCTAGLIGWDPRNSPPLSPHLGSNKRTLLDSQDGRHLFSTPCVTWRAFYHREHTKKETSLTPKKIRHHWGIVKTWNDVDSGKCLNTNDFILTTV